MTQTNRFFRKNLHWQSQILRTLLRKNIKAIILFFLSVTIIQTTHAQFFELPKDQITTINYKVQINIVGSSECTDCFGDPELNFVMQADDNRNNQWNWSMQTGDCTPPGVYEIFCEVNDVHVYEGQSGISINFKGGGWEDDGTNCGGDDGSCNGFILMQSRNQCGLGNVGTWQFASKTVVCDGVNWTYDYEFYFEYKDVNPGEIATTSGEIYPECGIPNPLYSVQALYCGFSNKIQWQKRPSGGSWANISGATEEEYLPPAPLCESTDYRRRITVATENGNQSFYSNVITYTVDNALANCPLNQVLTQHPVPSCNYKAVNEITSIGEITTNSNINFSAGERTYLKPGFKSALGSKLNTDYQGCTFGNGETDAQTLLDLGYDPLEMYQAGIPASEILGKPYQGGLIFYLDTLDLYNFDGLITTVEKIKKSFWATTTYTDIPTIPNATNSPPSGPGADFMEGYTNSYSTGFASNLNAINNYLGYFLKNYYTYEDYWAPSIQTLIVIRDVLGEMDDATYWSSSEYDKDEAWAINFNNGVPQHIGKQSQLCFLRPVRSFKKHCDVDIDLQTELDIGCRDPMTMIYELESADDMLDLEYQGGRICYIDSDDLYDFDGLIINKEEFNVNQDDNWGCINQDLDMVENVQNNPPSGLGADVGQGEINTNFGCNSADSPASIAKGFETGNYSDWFFPSINELELLEPYYNTYNSTQFTLESKYWSSTEASATTAWSYDFSAPLNTKKQIENKSEGGDTHSYRFLRKF